MEICFVTRGTNSYQFALLSMLHQSFTLTPEQSSTVSAFNDHSFSHTRPEVVGNFQVLWDELRDEPQSTTSSRGSILPTCARGVLPSITLKTYWLEGTYLHSIAVGKWCRLCDRRMQQSIDALLPLTSRP
jgi:hypothetical protein